MGLLWAVLSLVYARAHLCFSNDRTRMLAPDEPAQRRYEAYRTQFGAWPELAVLVSCAEAVARESAVDDLVSVLSREPELHGLTGWLALPDLPAQGLYYLDSQRLDELERWVGSEVSADPRVTAQLLEAIHSRGRGPYRSPFGPSPPPPRQRLYLEMGADTAVVVARVPRDGPGLLERLRAAVAGVQRRHPGVSLSLGGDYVGFSDDGRSARRTAWQVSLISLVLVHGFFRWAFGRAGPPRMALATVLVSLCWSAAWAAWLTPTLNLITINFAATLIGLGMDCNVQMLYRYNECLQREERGQALARTLLSAGRENLVGTLAASAAFFSLTATPFVGVAQLGRISGGGVLLGWLASVTILPALLVRFPLTARPLPSSRWQDWERAWRARPRVVLALAGLVTLLALARLGHPRFDYNLLNMMPEGAAALEIDREFHRRCGVCSLYAVSLATSESEMRRRAQQFRALSSVARVESPGDWIPPQPGQRREQIARILRKAAGMVEPPPVGRLTVAELNRLRQSYQKDDSEVSRALRGLGPGPIQDALSYFFQELNRDLTGRLQWLHRQKLEPLPDWRALPTELMARYRSAGGWLLKIYPRGHIWEREPLEHFLGQLRKVDPQVTGQADLNHTYLEQLRSSYWVAGGNALAAVTMLLLLAFRRPGRALLALAPKLLGAVWMLGAMGWLGVNFNPANATALPLTLGIGLVFGVHVVHHGRRPVFQGSMGQAVMVSGLSTVLGYVSLLTSPYRGVASLGLVMVLGIVSSLVASLVVLPAALQLGRVDN